MSAHTVPFRTAPTANELISVVIPAFNAAPFIRRTIASAQAQTYRKIEIIVVDDGSTDDTAEIVGDLAVQDPRIRLVRQANAGVATARNTGIECACGEYVAPLDADDLWHKDKLRSQMAAFVRAPNLVLVYAWFVVIDEADRVVDLPGYLPEYEGWAGAALITGNFIGNASCPLMRRSVLREIGGYDPALRHTGAEGCEDWKLYLAMAEHGEIGVVRELLVGYREYSSSMSGSVWRMKRSYDLVLAQARSRHPELPGCLFRWSRGYMYLWLAAKCARRRDYGEAAALSVLGIFRDPGLLLMPWFIRKIVRGLLSHPTMAPLRKLRNLQVRLARAWATRRADLLASGPAPDSVSFDQLRVIVPSLPPTSAAGFLLSRRRAYIEKVRSGCETPLNGGD